MATREAKRLSDGFIKLDAGMNSGVAPSDPLLALRNQVSFAINTRFRGGWPMPRPGYRKVGLAFPDDATETAFREALFQEAGAYNPDDGSLNLISMHGGRVFRTAVTNMDTFQVSEISIAGDLNPSNRTRAWGVQAENYWIIQDGQTLPFIYNGASARRAMANEVPVGSVMAYGMGRLWVARGRFYVGGDIVLGPSGTAANGYRDSVLKFTENTYIAEGGAFGVPLYAGDITGLQFIENLNTALGVGDLIIHTRRGVFANSVPPDRASWKNLTEPVQRVIQRKRGALSADSIADSNGDQFYRSTDGIRSLAFSVRNFGQWGNTPIGSEMDRIIAADARNLLPFSRSAVFDNRLLMTCTPYQTPRGVAHRALISLDFDPLNTMADKRPPAYDGIWTGVQVLKQVVGEQDGVERCFIYAVNSDNEIELWELTLDEQNDRGEAGIVPITWTYETRNFDFANRFDIKKLDSADFFCDRVSGSVDFTVEYRPDSYPCWVPWEEWQECATTQLCAEDFAECPRLPNYQEQYRPKRQFKQPGDEFDALVKQQYRTGFEFGFRFTTTGFCRHKQCRFHAIEVQELPYGGQL